MNNAADVRTLGICAGKAVLAALYWHCWDSMGPVSYAVATVVMFCASFYVATMVHDAMHCRVFHHKGIEAVWEVLLSGVFGFPTEAYRPTHNPNHHVYTELEEDHLQTAQMQYKLPLANLLLFFPTVYPAISKLEQEYIRQEARKLSKSFFMIVADMICAHGVTLTLLYLDWRKGLAIWFLPNVLGVDAILTMNLLQHGGCEPIVRGKHKGEEMEINSARRAAGDAAVQTARHRRVNSRAGLRRAWPGA